MTRHTNSAWPRRTPGRSERTFFLLILFLFSSGPVLALDPSRHLAQYGHTSWRQQDGYFPGVPQAITQTADGYLWIGTGSGLVRFDGVRFLPWVFPQGQNLLSTSVFALLGSRDGSLWIGTGSGISRWKDGHLVNYRENRGRINAIRESQDGSIWFVRTRSRDENGPFCRVLGEAVKCYGQPEGITFRYSQTLASDLHGGFWIGSGLGLCHWSTKGVTNYFPERLRDGTGLTGVVAFDLLADGSPLVGLGQAGPGFGLQTLVGGVWRDYRPSATENMAFPVAGLFIDRDHGIWISTVDAGLYHVSQGRVDRFRQADGLSSDSITGFYEDREGSVWTISPDGIDRFRDLAVGNISTRDGLQPDVGSVSPARNGNVWVGGGVSLNQIETGKLSVASAPHALPVRRVTALIEDHAGRLWIGAEQGMAVLANGSFHTITKGKDGSALGMLASFVEDTDQNIWALIAARPFRLVCIRNLQVAMDIVLPGGPSGGALAADPTGGIWVGFSNGELIRYRFNVDRIVVASDGSGAVRAVLVDSDGSTWAATEHGLVRRKDGIHRNVDVRNGLPCDNFFSAIRDDSGALWLYASCGLIQIASTELERWWQNPERRVEVKVFDAFDGANPNLASFGPVAAKSADGRLWFTNDAAVQFVDPAHLPRNTLPPPVQVEQIVADRVAHVPSDELRLPALTRDLRIDYTALSMVVPQKVRFRYKLEGRDAQWEEAGTRRQAFYTDLPPNHYRFRVVACNNDGVWNEAGASITFSIAPAYYQTSWFLAMCISGGLLAFWAIYRLRIRQIAAEISLRFEERTAERNRLSGELHDTVLQSVQMSKMVADHALNDPSVNTPEGLRNALTTLSTWLSQATTDARAALNSLRTSSTPVEDLAEAFRQAAEQSVVSDQLEVVVSVEGAPREMHSLVRDEVYRIGCEAIRNACLHSGATEVLVKVGYARNLTIRVQDNGKGIDPAVATAGRPGHFGLAGMQERALRIDGQFQILSRAGSGTDIELVIPGKVAYTRGRHKTVLEKVRRFLGIAGIHGE